jgi:hypothetical protein
MSLGDQIEFAGGFYEVRGMVDGRYVVRVRNRDRNKEVYKVWTESERNDFDKVQKNRADNADRNAQIYERNLAGETKASLAREFSLSPTSIGQICAKQTRKEKSGNIRQSRTR